MGGRDPGKPLASAGFRIGIQTELNDYRAAVFHGTGLDVGVAPNGGLFIGKMMTSIANPAVRKAAAIELRLKANPLNQDRYQLVLTAVNLADGKSLAEIERL